MSKTMETFGELVFNKEVMKTRLSKNAYTQLMDIITKESPLDKEIAGEIAHSIKEWAIENGATHYTHWFQPLREGTAEKHYAFINYNEDGEIIERLSAEQFIQSEPDASSFPSGGIRSTFEARGYTAWDPTSPVFLMENKKSKTLVIPSVFLSWTGEVLDQKTALLRSKKALNNVGMKIQKLLGNRNAKKIQVWLGIEQEYFLIPKSIYNTRPDIKICGKTLFGAPAAKGQQFKDHYFGAIKESIMNFMEDFDHELYRKGIPAKARHNEASPNQFEITPLHEEENLAIDHNLQIMNILKEVADRHDLVALLHEKPFNGVNGSGKHINWSIGDNTGANYLEPSASPLRNVTLLMTVVSLMLGLKKYGALLRSSVADASNDDRLGSSEAPPYIISLYLGEYLSSLLQEIETLNKVTEKKMAEISLGIRQLPSIIKDVSDRNRTSPLAFTGNKFEFRALGASQNCSEAATILNMLVTYGYELIYEKLSKMKGDPRTDSLLILKDFLKESKDVHFDGNCYSEDWHIEAKKRGLPIIKDTPSALTHITLPANVELFATQNILSERELQARQYIKYRKYIKTRQIELKTACDIAQTQILPSILKQISLIGSSLSFCSTTKINTLSFMEDIQLLADIYTKIKSIVFSIRTKMDEIESLEDQAIISNSYYNLNLTELAQLRANVDLAETLIAKEYWPLASYQELFTTL